MHPIAANVVECKASINAGIAQLVERNLAKVEVESSRLFSRSKFQKREASASLFCQGSGFWRGSKAVMPRIANPVSPVRLRTAPPEHHWSNPMQQGPSGPFLLGRFSGRSEKIFQKNVLSFWRAKK